MAFDTATLSKARESGYSDEEVSQFVVQSDPRVKTALDSGYTLDEVASFFDQKEKPTEQTYGDKSSRFLAAASSQGINALAGATRLGQFLQPQWSALFDEVAKSTGLATIGETITEMEGASERAKDDYGVDPKQDNSLLSSVATGAGSLLPTLATGPFAPAVNALSMGESGFREAEQEGGSELQKMGAFAGNAATGYVTEKLLGVPALLKAAQKAKLPEQALGGLIKSVVKQAGLSFAREGTQETLEQVSSDLIAKYISAYDPDRNVFDLEKLGKTFLVGGIVGAPVGGLVQAAVSLETPPKETMQADAEKIDASLAKIATLTPEEMSMVPEGTPEDLATLNQDAQTIPVDETQVPPGGAVEQPSGVQGGPNLQQSTPEEPSGTELPQEAQAEFVGTSINTPEGPITGQDIGSSHNTMTQEALEKGTPWETLGESSDPDAPPSALGFAFKKPDGTVEWVDRVEGGRRLTQMGLLKGLKEGEPVTSEHIRNKVAGVTFTPTPQITEDQAAETLQPFFEKAVAAARAAGATDPETAASQAQIELSQQVAQGKTKLDNPEALFSQAATLKARNQLTASQAQKRGGGIAPESLETSGAATTEGPRAELIAQESAKSISEVIEAMPENDRKVMQAMMDDPSLTEDMLAEETGLSVDQVTRAKKRAKAALKRFIKKEGIGERMAPGAASRREFTRVRYIAAADIYEGLRASNQLSRSTWEKNMMREYEDAFTPDELNEAWAAAQEISQSFQESKGRRPISSIADELTGMTMREGETGIRNKVADRERRKRGLPAAFTAARRTHTTVWDEAMRMMDEDKQIQGRIVDKFRNNPLETASDVETAILLHEQIQRENQYDEAIDEVNQAYDKGDERAKAEAWSRAKEEEAKLIEIYDINKVVGTAQGRALSARRMMAGRDYTLARMVAEERASKGGIPLTEDETLRIQKEFDAIQQTQNDLRERINQLEEQDAREAYEESLKDMGSPDDPVVKSLVQRVVERLNSAAAKARARIRARAQSFHSGIDPVVLYDVAVIGASKIANGLTRKSKWRTAMLEDLGNDIPDLSESLDLAWEESNRLVDQAADSVEPKNRDKVKKTLKGLTSQQVLDTMESKMKARIEDGDSINDLRAYIQRMALELVRQGNTTPDGLLDTIHAIVEPMSKGITKRQVMDLISGYGDSKALDPEKAKARLRDIKGQYQQLAKLEDIRSRVPIQKTGVERRIPSDAERRLIKEVNEAKKKFGVVVTNPERQLKSTLDAIKTRIKNQIKDLTHQIETGEKPATGTPPPTDEEVERLKATVTQLRSTLKDLEGKPEMTEEQRIRLAETALERSIAHYEQRIKDGETTKEKTVPIKSAKIDALKARRDALRDELEALRAADHNLQNTRLFDRLMQTADELQAKLDRGDIAKETKAARMEDELVKEARDKVQALRDQMQAARDATPEAQQAKLASAINAVQRSIDAYDARLKTGAIEPAAGKPKVTSPILDRLRAERDAMRKLVQELRKPAPMDPEQAALKAFRARLSRANADIQERIARGDFSKKVRKELDLSKDAEAVRLRAENDKLKREFENRKLENERATETGLKKALRLGKESLNIPRALKSSLDFSAVLRQGGFLTFGNPIRATKALRDMFSSLTQSGFEKTEARIKSRPNYEKYKASKLYLADLDGALDRREEAFRSELADKIPGVKLSNRTYIAYLNRLRADSFDALVESTGATSTDQLKAIAHFINVATGRGDLGAHGSAAETLSTVLWSPRLLISRFQLLAGDPILRSNAKGVRTAIAKEYAKALAGVGVVMALGALAGADIEDDPRSSDYLKLKFGNTRIDPWMGLQQVTVLLSRLLSGETRTQKGQILSLVKTDDKKRPPWAETAADVLFRFVRTKMTPLLGAGIDYLSGENVVGDKVPRFDVRKPETLPEAAGYQAKSTLAPLSFGDMIPIMKEHGIPQGTAMQLLNLFGMSVQHYEDKKKKN